MRLKIFQTTLRLLLALSGLGLLFIAVFAYQIGLDNDTEWGNTRKLMALIGVCCCLGSWLLVQHKKVATFIAQTGLFGFFQKFWHRLVIRLNPGQRFLERSKTILDPSIKKPALSSHPWINVLLSKNFLLSGIAAMLAIMVYIWGFSAGTMTTWPWSSDYFDRQAEAFMAGQLALLEQPSAELLALSDPYDYRNREGVNFIWDATFYNGKYYLYWGPIPALMAVVLKTMGLGVVQDQYLLAIFLCGFAIVFSLLLNLLRRRFFPTAPAWTLLLLSLLGSLALPVLWLVYRPKMYETAIAAGQFFLFLGLLFLFLGLRKKRAQFFWFGLSGLAWGFAIGSRFNLTPTVIFLAGMVAVQQIWFAREEKIKIRLSRLIVLGTPLMICLALLGGYNAARFGSPLETGHRYQLTGPALPASYQSVFSPQYILPNTYSYLLRPPLIIKTEFPFVFTPYIRESMWPFYIRLPETYGYSEPVTGIFRSTPALWLLFLPVFGGIRRFHNWLHEKPGSLFPGPDNMRFWLWVTVFGSLMVSLSMILIFISSSMRYLADVTPLFVLMAAIGWWYGHEFFQGRSVLRFLLSVSAVVLILISIVFSQLANFQNYDQRFINANPQLYHLIADFLVR